MVTSGCEHLEFKGEAWLEINQWKLVMSWCRQEQWARDEALGSYTEETAVITLLSEQALPHGTPRNRASGR